MKIYIACSLTHLPRSIFEEYTNFIHQIAITLKKYSHDVKYALVNSDPQLALKPEDSKSRLCYLWDRKMVEDADLIIAEASFPSTGLGVELQIAENKDIPILICYKDFGTNKAPSITYENPDHIKHTLQIGEGYISHMVLGIPSIFKVLEYSDYQKGILDIIEGVNLLSD